MCGIAGIVSTKIHEADLLERMLSRIAHRGPEYQGVWSNEDKTVLLGHRRLAIIDLSPTGRQPMQREHGRFTITFNGEIYNYQELKKELEKKGAAFNTASDTEVILAAYQQWGMACVKRIHGMFAFAIWDDVTKKLFAARDRIGEKPFKYWYHNGTLVFASEIKALLEYPHIPRQINWSMIDVALSVRFIPSPETGFIGIHKLPPAHTLLWEKGTLTIERYWDLPSEITKDSYALCKEKLTSLFSDSVRERMISDVPLGAFLSGGVDSTSVVAAMAQQSARPIKTFVISMDGTSEDQRYSRIAADTFGTDHHEIAISDIDYQKEVRNLVAYYDEPFFDQSTLPTTVISRYIKKEVTVVLSGDGGDELFGGYEAYSVARLLARYQRIPKWIRAALSRVALPNSLRYRAEIMERPFLSSYAEYYSLWKRNLPLSKRYMTKNDVYKKDFYNDTSLDSITQLFNEWFGTIKDRVAGAMRADIYGRLADGYLTKTDIGTMASALELRTPFLDHRLVEYAATIPSAWKIKSGGKYIWKDIARALVPNVIIDRKKMGFGIPLDRIVNNQLAPLIQEVLGNPQSALYEKIEYKMVRLLIDDHACRRADYSNHLWSLLMLELWIQTYIEK